MGGLRALALCIIGTLRGGGVGGNKGYLRKYSPLTPLPLTPGVPMICIQILTVSIEVVACSTLFSDVGS